jgi:hypothetical protein
MDYKTDISKYSASVNEKAVAAIVKFCGIALKSRDSSLVSVTDDAELERIRNGFAAKALKLSKDECDKVIASVSAAMKAEKNKSRVTFYYLMAETSGKLDSLA